jgi:hypothetical protein
MPDMRDVAADHAAMTRLFRTIIGWDDDALSEEQLDGRAQLIGRYPDAWELAQRLGPFPATLH